MILHYLKVAIRNLLAHKTQTLVSLFGLAIAFACVSLAAYWNHYERTYDSFQENADRIYRIRYISDNPGSPEGASTHGKLHQYLKEKFPEIEAACATCPSAGFSESQLHNITNGYSVSINGVTYPERVTMQTVTSDAFHIFGLEWVEGNENPMSYTKDEIAISDQLARKMCGNKSPVGETLVMQFNGFTNETTKLERIIAGVYKSKPRHSNLAFDMVYPREIEYGWSEWGYHTYVLLKPDVNHEKFIQKMQTDTARVEVTGKAFVPGIVTPLTALRYTYPEEGVNATLKDANLFASAAVLLALCALLNYLTLFVSRLRARGRDMALRTICGSSAWQMSGLLLTEYLLLLLFASLVGMLLVELAMYKFMELAMIRIEFASVMLSCAYLMLFSVVLSVLLSTVPIFYFKRKTLRVQIEATPVRLGKNHFRSIAVCVQLIFGFLFIFSTIVMMKQVYMLINTDNIERKQIAWVSLPKTKDMDLVQDILRQQPFINDFLGVTGALYPPKTNNFNVLRDWEGKSADESNIHTSVYHVNDEFVQFYGLKMKEGSASFELGKNEVFINETLARMMNMDNPIGKTLNNRLKIKGVIFDFQVQNPKIPSQPILYVPSAWASLKNYIAFKYNGEWKSCKQILKKEFQEKGLKGRYSFEDGEEYYQYFLKSEFNLLKLLGVITVVSILIAIFGIYALIMQSCDQHRKEIAIRKVYGAGVTDILMMFFKQYMMQVVVAAVVAFPIGYVLMKNWLEQYTRQTEISIWIYLCIFLGISLLVTLCIGWRVWKAANENPAWVIKKE